MLHISCLHQTREILTDSEQNTGLPKTDERPTDSAPKFAKPGSQGQQYVKDQESQLLNIFTQEKSFQLGGGLILGLLVLFALAGPP